MSNSPTGRTLRCGCNQGHVQEPDTDTRRTMYTQGEYMKLPNESN